MKEVKIFNCYLKCKKFSFETDTLSSLEDVISQSTGAMDEVRSKLQSKEDMIIQLEQQLRHQSASGTLRLSPSHSLLLRCKASPLRDILLTGPYMSSKVRTGRNKDLNFKSPPETARCSSTFGKTTDRTLPLNTFYGANPAISNPVIMPTSPYVDYMSSSNGAGGRTNEEHGVKSREDCQETNISYIEPVMASTMLGQSMFETSPALQVRSRKHVSFFENKKVFARKVPFGSHAYPSRDPLPNKSLGSPAVSILSECSEESDSSVTSIPLGASGLSDRQMFIMNKENSNQINVERGGNTTREIESSLKKKCKELPFEHPLSSVTSPKYMDIFREQMVHKKISKSSMNSTLNARSVSMSTQNKSKIASLVEKFEIGSNSTNSIVLNKRVVRRRSKIYKRTSPVCQKRGLSGFQARSNKASELRMKAKLRSANKSKNNAGDSKEMLFSIGKF